MLAVTVQHMHVELEKTVRYVQNVGTTALTLSISTETKIYAIGYLSDRRIQTLNSKIVEAFPINKVSALLHALDAVYGPRCQQKVSESNQESLDSFLYHIGLNFKFTVLREFRMVDRPAAF